MSHKLILVAALLVLPCAHAADPPRVRMENGASQLVVNGKPFLLLGGELGNSSAGTAAQADSILPEMARLHLNTVLMPVAWDQLEPRESVFDFTILDHWIDVARAQKLRLVLLWFGSWKNAFSEYAPAWVKSDTKRFPRALLPGGAPTEILSTFGAETLRLDSRAFAALMKHLREKDQDAQTVLMVQIENEVGFLGPGRDRSPEADRHFSAPVPRNLIQALSCAEERALSSASGANVGQALSPAAGARARPCSPLSPELSPHFNPQGTTWRDVFGEAANEVFMSWRYALFMNSVAEAGKKEYPLPMFVNAQLPALMERPGEYPSGGPHPYYLAVYRAVAPAIDFYTPDIYWPEFEYWVKRYQIPGNPIFIPEARLEPSPYNALYAYGAAKALGFCPFGIDSLHAKDDPAISQVYAALAALGDDLPAAQAAGRTRGIVLHANSPRGTQTVALGGYLFQSSLSRQWSTNALLANDGAMLVLEAAPNEFLVIGAGLTVRMTRDPDTDSRTAGIASIEEVARTGSTWSILSRLNGDQSNQGRQLTLDSHRIRTYRLRLYAASE